MGNSVERFCLAFFLCLLLTFPGSEGRNILQSFATEESTETAVTETTVDEGTSSVEEESSPTGESTGTSSTGESVEFSTPEEDAEGAVTQTVVEETDVTEESTFEEDTYVTEESTFEEDTYVTEESTFEEDTYVTEESTFEEDTYVTEESTFEEDTYVTEESPFEEETDVTEESPFEEDTMGSGSVNASVVAGSESDEAAFEDSLYGPTAFAGDVACDFCEVPSCNRRARTKYKFKSRHVLLKMPNVDDWGGCCQLCQQFEECTVWTHNSKKEECIMLRPRNYASKTNSKFSSGTLL